MSNQEPKFFVCEQCGIIIEEINGDKCEYTCEGNPLKELVANTTDAAQEKHVPVVEQSGHIITVKVGNVFHPMSEEHSIVWVYLHTKKGGYRINLSPSDEPVAIFTLTADDTPIAAYAYCNLHGFWKTTI